MSEVKKPAIFWQTLKPIPNFIFLYYNSPTPQLLGLVFFLLTDLTFRLCMMLLEGGGNKVFCDILSKM